MIHKGTVLESRRNVTPYLCRVPTHSNVSDGPSRGSFNLCFSLGAKRVAADAQQLIKLALASSPGDEMQMG